MKTLVYHKDCMDGFCAAWLFQRVYPDAELIPAQYGQNPPDLTGKEVVIADFSYPREQMDLIINQCKSLVVLDHHKSAKEALEPLTALYPYTDGDDADRIQIRFDMDKSGAMLMWEHLFADIEPSWVVKYVQDRDLWQWKLGNSKEVNAALGSFPKDFAVWNNLSNRSEFEMAMEGIAILRYQQGVVDHHCKVAERQMIAGYDVPCVNATTLISEIGNQLAEGEPFAAMYFIQGDQQVFSLRSSEEGLDVAEIAKRYGGGGHKHAAGFRVNVAEWPI